MTDQQLTEQFEKDFDRDDVRTFFDIYKAGYLLGLGKLDELKEMIEKEMAEADKVLEKYREFEFPNEFHYADGGKEAFIAVLKIVEQIKKESEKE